MADDVVVVAWHVTKFPGISRLAVVEFAVDDDTDSDAPTYVDEDHILESFAASLDEFGVGHAPSVVLDANRELDHL